MSVTLIEFDMHEVETHTLIQLNNIRNSIMFFIGKLNFCSSDHRLD